jgi:hypothetical protein
MGLFRREGVQKATFAEAATTSSVIRTDGFAAISLLLPAAWTAGTMTFQGSADGTSFADLADDSGTAATLTDAIMQANLSKWITLVNYAGVVFPFKFLRLRSQNAQAAARSFTIVMRS